MRPKLKLEALVVESFDTEEGNAGARGTVHAHGPTDGVGESCDDTCGPREDSWCAICHPETHTCPFTDPRFDPGCG